MHADVGGGSIVTDGRGFRAVMPAVNGSARFDASGVSLQGPEASRVSVHTLAWGRDRALVSAAFDAPRLGDCVTAVDAHGRCSQRLEYVADGITEWWVGLGNGVEQGWELDARPAGQGALVFDVAIEGAGLLEQDADEVLVLDDGGNTWTIGGVTAWDATGRTLPAELVVRGDGIRLRVDDAGAVYPVTVDPLYTSATWVVNGDPTAGEGLGSRVAAAGDVNNDGYGDVLVASPSYTVGADFGSGAVRVYHGSATGLSTIAATLLEGQPGEKFGTSIDGAGDVNGDGYDDIIVSATEHASATGRAVVLYGSATGIQTAGATEFVGSNTNEFFGIAVAGLGDVNGDGKDDVAVGAYGWDVDHALNSTSNEGRVYVFQGSAAGASTTPATTLTGDVSDGMGYALAGGDYNGDTFADVAVSLSTNPSLGPQHVHVYYGSASGITTVGAADLTGPNNAFGTTLESANVNGDGFDDLIANGATSAFAYSDTVSVFPGSSGGVSTTPAASLVDPDNVDAFGFSLAGGDADKDGYDDLIVCADQWVDPTSTGVSTGKLFFYSGSTTGLVTTPNMTLRGVDPDDHFCSSAAITDVDKDGYGDAVIGSIGPNAFGGRAELFRGAEAASAEDKDNDGFTTPDDCDDDNKDINPDAAEKCDLNDVDEDCDELADDYDPDATGKGTWYIDSDSDDYGVPTVTLTVCDQPEHFVDNDTDCDDFDALRNPGATEICDDGIDNNCDNVQDEGCGSCGDGKWDSATEECDDADKTSGDGCSATCTIEAGYTCSNAPQLNTGSTLGGSAASVDADDSVWSWATSVDGTTTPALVANNCAPGSWVDAPSTGHWVNRYGCGTTTPESTSTFYTASFELASEHAASQTVIDGTIWADNSVKDIWVNGFSTGVAFGPIGYNGAGVDFGAWPSSLYRAGTNTVVVEVYNDAGAIGNPDGLLVSIPNAFGIGSVCDKTCGDGTLDAWEECDDNNTADNDGCSALCLSETTDADNDGTPSSKDCDDHDPNVHPGAPELCNDEDDDCDDDIDEDPVGGDLYSPDLDEDGFGGSIPVTACTEPAKHMPYNNAAAKGFDCDDDDADVNPGAQEVCDPADVDEDCDSAADDMDPDAEGKSTWYLDSDDDSYGVAEVTMTACDQPDMFVDNDDDCNNNDATIHPGATDIPGDGIDQDCDGEDATTEACDVDGDGHEAITCNGDDCDDNDPDRFPGNEEIIDNGIDENCNEDDRTTWLQGGCSTGGGAPTSGLLLGVLAVLGLRRKGVRA